MRVMIHKPVRYLSAGRFLCDDAWRHPRRVLDHEVLLLALHGCAHIAQDDQRYCLLPGSYLLLRAGVPHYGYQEDAGVGYYWVHFCSDAARDRNEPPMELSVFEQDISTENALLLFRQLLHFANRPQLHTPADQALSDHMLTALLLELLCQSDMRRRAAENQRGSFQEILEWVRINLSHDISLSDVAENFHYRPKYFSHLFVQKTGVPFTRYLTERRITLACSLLSNTAQRVSEVAAQSGFGDEKHFMKTFKQYTGMTPSVYRASINRTHLNNG